MQHVYYQKHLRKTIEHVEEMLKVMVTDEAKQNLNAKRTWLLQELQRYQIAVFKR